MHRRPPLLIILLLLLVILSGVLIYGLRTMRTTNSEVLKASGTIEATITRLSPELAGIVKEIAVEEGQAVRRGEVLLRLDNALLNAQRDQALATLETARAAARTAQANFEMAQAQYDAALVTARLQQASQRLTDWAERAPDAFEQPLWYFSRQEQLAAAQAEVEAARTALEAAEGKVQEFSTDGSHAEFIAAEQRLNEARMAYQIAKQVHDRVRSLVRSASSENEALLNAARDQLDEAEQALRNAQEAYEVLLTTDQAQEVLKARAERSVAQERYESARDRLQALYQGEDAPQVRIAAAALNQAKAALEQANAAVNQAQANLQTLDIQIQKLTLFAPIDGIILARNAEVGEFFQPGATLLTLADLDALTITVYVPEDRYGRLALGQSARVSVDSFPGETFHASVIYISSQAEFTPRNVQTVEGRSSTVFAVKLRVEDPAHKLKPGMPADVVFE